MQWRSACDHREAHYTHMHCSDILTWVQDKDEELQTVYRRLSEACKERSDVRSALIGTQSELAETQAELDAWTHELDSFQQVLLLLS